MLLMSLLLLMLSHALPWIYLRSDIERSPEKLMSLLSGVMIFPYFLSLSLGGGGGIMQSIGDLYFHYLLIFSFVYSLGMLFLYLGCQVSYLIWRIRFPKIFFRSKGFEVTSLGLAYSMFFLSLALIFVRFELAGGIVDFINDIGNRSKNLSGGGWIDILLIPAVFIAALSFVWLYCDNNRIGILHLIIILSVLFISMALFGGRKVPIQIIIFSLLYFSILKSNFRIISLRLIPVYLLIVIFFSLMLYLRLKAQGNLESFNLNSLLGNTSYVDIYVYITKYFMEHDLWYGVGYFDLYYKIFGGLVGNVPIDDGVYIYNLYKGVEVSPPEVMENMLHSSLPPESYGAGYLNFGSLGVLAYFFLRGGVVAITFCYAKSKCFSPVYFYIYLFMLFTFHLSVLRITQLLMLCVGLIVLFICVKIMSLFISKRKTI